MKRPLLRVVSILPVIISLVVVLGAILYPVATRAQFSSSPTSVQSVSGQFVVGAAQGSSPLLHDEEFATNANFIRLDPSLLVVSAERFKDDIWQELGLKPDAPWSGKIFLTLHPAESPDDVARLAVGPFLDAWSCRVELPDLVTLTRYGRALSAAVLLEMASRSQTNLDRTPEIPAWLADGMAQLVYGRDAERIVLSLPSRSMNGVSQNRLDKTEPGMDPLANARRTLQNNPTLTFDQFCWPDDQQVNGDDGGVYLASVEYFTSELLTLPNGQAKMRNFLADLPGCYNWQTAFYQAFGQNFRRPLEVEKWWSLAVVRFTSRDPGPHWNVDVSRDHLAALLTVPVEYRSSSNSMPVHMQVSLQSAVENFSQSERDSVLEARWRELAVAQLRLIQPYGGLAGGYAAALADFLGEGRQTVPTVVNKHVIDMRHTASAALTVRRLNLLDAQRRQVELRFSPARLPGGLNQDAPPANLTGHDSQL